MSQIRAEYRINCKKNTFLSKRQPQMTCSECCSVFWLSFWPIRSEQLAHKKKADLSEQPDRTDQIGAPLISYHGGLWESDKNSLNQTSRKTRTNKTKSTRLCIWKKHPVTAPTTLQWCIWCTGRGCENRYNISGFREGFRQGGPQYTSKEDDWPQDKRIGGHVDKKSY